MTSEIETLPRGACSKDFRYFWPWYEAKRGKRAWRFPWVFTVNSLEALSAGLAIKTTQVLLSDQGYGLQQKAALKSEKMQAGRR